MATYDWFEIDMRDGREAGSFKTKAPRTSDWPEEWIHGRIIPRHYLMASLVLLPSNCRRKTPNKIIWRGSHVFVMPYRGQHLTRLS